MQYSIELHLQQIPVLKDTDSIRLGTTQEDSDGMQRPATGCFLTEKLTHFENNNYKVHKQYFF